MNGIIWVPKNCLGMDGHTFFVALGPGVETLYTTEATRDVKPALG